ncbi:MAG TPA: acyl-CoA desaturase [Acidimicrobiales bacterium]|nr:acyl-CoA desaturase [Acidimicrobiales bacterium]
MTTAVIPPGGKGAEARTEGTDWLSAIPFLLFHLVPLLAFVTGMSLKSLVLAAVLYVTRMFFVTAGYHRYFAHKTYSMNRVAQCLMAIGGITAAQKGPLWWAAHHRAHHRYADTDRDPHSPRGGFWWSHVGWILSREWKGTDTSLITDLTRYPELRVVDRLQWLGPWALGVLCYVIDGWTGVVVGLAWSTVALWHATFSVNSLAHLIGRRRYATPDDSRNSWLIALATLGEGWHNNHHHYPMAARQGFRWWELDISFYVLKLLQGLGITRGLKKVPAKARVSRLIGSAASAASAAKAKAVEAAEVAKATAAGAAVKAKDTAAAAAEAATAHCRVTPATGS